MSLQKVTSDTNECSAERFFNGFDRVSIPLFQRGYAWGSKQFERFREEVERSVDIDDRTQFLGAVVAVKRSTGINNPNEFEIVDGQQRMITIYLAVLAASYVLAENQNSDKAALLAKRYLFHADLSGANTKIFPSRIDSAEFDELWTHVLSQKDFHKSLNGSYPRPPQASGSVNKTPQIRKQFDRCVRWLRRVAKADGVARVESYVDAALTRLSMVYLELQDAASAPTIFEGLNNGGLKVTVGDLVRNEVFSKLRTDPDLAQNIFDGPWKAFESELGAQYQDFFFPYGLILDRQTKKGDLFSGLRQRWRDEHNVEAIIAGMRDYVPAFQAIAIGKAPTWATPQLRASISRYARMGCVPSTVRPFIMQLLYFAQVSVEKQQIAVEVMSVVETFLVRRAICGHEPTGLHAVFKGLWEHVQSTLSAITVRDKIRSYKTVQWPDDESLRKAIRERSLYKSNVIDYLVNEYNSSLAGDIPTSKPEIEHVLPQRPAAGWEHISADARIKWMHTWANLVVCSPPMNKEMSNAPYDQKRPRFLEDSMYKSARQLAEKYTSWDEESLAQRANELAEFAVTRWSS
jgi:hypothetical protein